MNEISPAGLAAPVEPTPAGRRGAPLESPLVEAERARRLARFESIVATIPAAIPPELRREYVAYVALAVANNGRRGLARLHWPWNEAPVERTPRGRRAPRGKPCD